MVGRSNILIDKDFRDLLPKGASNFEGQTQVGVKSALINAVDGLRVTPTRAANLPVTIPAPRAVHANEF